MVGQAFVELVETLRGQISVRRICELMGVARATYYRWRKQKGTQTTKEKRDRDVGETCAAHKYRYGYRKIASFFPNLAEKTVQKIMQKYNWSCRVKVKKRKRTGQPTSIAPNHLERNFHATDPLQKLVTDITYLPFGQSMLYLSSIMDLYNGEIIAYTIGTTQDTLFVLDTLKQVEGISSEAILRSDQGSVYTSYEYQKQVKEKGITMSMSRKGTPADNSPIETFHSSLKSETFYLDGIHSTTNACVIRIVEEYINYYNNIRIQTKLNNQSPVQYRQLAV